MKSDRLVPILVCWLLLIGTTLQCSAGELAALTGRVTDSQGLVVPGVKVQAINVDTNVSYSGETNGDGLFRISGIPSGSYRVIVQKPGFVQIVKPGVELHVQDDVTLNFTVRLGSVSETVTVEEGASMINTTNAAVSTVVDQTYVKNMPLNGRSFQDLILLTPGTVTQTPQAAFGISSLGFSGEFSVNGQRLESNYYTVDGVSANVGSPSSGFSIGGAGASGSVAAATALGTTQALVSVDDLREFRVQSSTYSAEYGRNPGGQFAYETKSGTNQWHGTAYDYLRNDLFDANNWFNDYFNVKGAALRQNDFGGTLGGPVTIPSLYKGNDKTFFFASYEGLRLTAPQPAAAIFVPDATLRANAPAPLNQVLNAFPLPSPTGIDDTKNGFAQFIGSWSNPSSIDSTSVRFDHVLNNNLRLFFRFSDTASRGAVRGNAGNAPTTVDTAAYTLRTYTAGVSGALSSRLSNEFRLNYSSNDVTDRQTIDAFGGGTPVNLVQLTDLTPDANPVVWLLYGASPFLSLEPKSGSQRQWNLVDTVSLSRGRHQFKFGMDYRRLAPFATRPTPSVAWLYFNRSAVETNSARASAQAYAPFYPLYQNFSAFAQDEWRVSQRLTFSMGLRWEVNPAPGVTQGLMPYTIQGSSPDTWTLAPQGTPLWRTTWYNFAPRLGAAYVLRSAPTWETVIRGGGGVFFDTGQQLGSLSFTGPGFRAQTPRGPGAFPVLPVIPNIVNPAVPPFPFVAGFSQHLQLPYTLQWNVSIEQALGKSQALTMSYVGSHAARLLQQNAFSPSNNANSGFFLLGENGLTSDYDSAQVQFRRRLSRGLTTLVSYTWAHCLDYGSQNYNFAYQRGNCDPDVRHNLSASFSYDLPSIGRNALVKAVLSHWGLDNRFTARSAFPVTLYGNTSVDAVTGQQFDAGLDLVPGQPIYLYGANCTATLQALGGLAAGQGCPGGRAVNPNAFVQVPVDPNTGNPIRQGTAPRNLVRGFAAWQMNLAIRRDFPIRERLKLQFRAEAFNIFNHPNFGALDPFLGDPTFGQATTTLANSLGILNPLYQMGGPRSMQFALKIVF